MKNLRSITDFLSEDLNEAFDPLLLEARIDKLKEIYKDKIDTSHDMQAHEANKTSDDIIDELSSHDPSPNKKHTQWLVGQYKRGNIRLEDGGRINSTLSNFDSHRRKLDNSDLGSYKHISDVDSAVEPHIGSFTSKKEENRAAKVEGADLIHDHPDLSVHHVKTKDAACLYGKNTKWCTASDNDHYNQFDYYNKEGNLYVVQNKRAEEGENKKYQFHFESGQLGDEQDRMHDAGTLAKKMPELRNVREFQKHSLHFNTPHSAHARLMDIENQSSSFQEEVAKTHDINSIFKD